VAGLGHKLDLVAQLLGLVAQDLVQAGIVQALDGLAVLHLAAVGGAEQVDPVLQQVEHPLEALAHADGPGHRGASDAQDLLHLVHELHRFAAFAVELVHEGHDGGGAQAADIHELARALLHTLGGVDDHERRVHGGEGAVGVLGEIAVARGVEQVDDALAVGELHHRRGHRDAALLLHGHPVGGGVAIGLAPLHGAGVLDGAPVEQELLGERGLAGVRVGNDGEGAPALDFSF